MNIYCFIYMINIYVLNLKLQKNRVLNEILSNSLMDFYW